MEAHETIKTLFSLDSHGRIGAIFSCFVVTSQLLHCLPPFKAAIGHELLVESGPLREKAEGKKC